MEKMCKICKVFKKLSDFPKAKTTKDKLDIYCKDCKKIAQAMWYARSRATEKPKRMLRRAKKRARQKGLVFAITLEDITPLPEFCPVLGLALNYSRAGLPAADSPSLDRFDNTIGYTPENVRVISNRANMIKCDATYEEVMAVAEFMKPPKLSCIP